MSFCYWINFFIFFLGRSVDRIPAEIGHRYIRRLVPVAAVGDGPGPIQRSRRSLGHPGVHDAAHSAAAHL